MSLTIAIFIGLSLAIMFLFFYMFQRDKEIDKKFHMIGEALENINQEIYKIQEEQEKNSIQNVRKMISKELDIILENLLESLNETQNQNKQEIERLVDRILKIESNVKTLSLPKFDTKVNTKTDDIDSIKELYEMGWSIEDIAKELGKNAGEIQFIIKKINFLK